MGVGLAVAASGAALVALSGWMWSGRSPRARWWAGRPFGPRLALGLLPGLGLVLLSAGALTAAGAPATPLAAPAMLLGLVLVLAGAAPLLPGWLGPGWYRRLPPGQRDGDTATPLAAAIRGYLGPAAASSAVEATARLGGPPLDSWRAGWVRDPDSDRRAHGMARRGTVDGRLLLHRGGLVFAASRVEDALLGRSTVVAVGAGEVIDVRVVPPRAGADGRPRPGRLHRSRFSRLVVRTAGADHVFEVAWGRASRVAERLRAVIAA
jgi:hypothetical protein